VEAIGDGANQAVSQVSPTSVGWNPFREDDRALPVVFDNAAFVSHAKLGEK
jgi:hypothetical protein